MVCDRIAVQTVRCVSATVWNGGWEAEGTAGAWGANETGIAGIDRQAQTGHFRNKEETVGMYFINICYLFSNVIVHSVICMWDLRFQQHWRFRFGLLSVCLWQCVAYSLGLVTWNLWGEEVRQRGRTRTQYYTVSTTSCKYLQDSRYQF